MPDIFQPHLWRRLSLGLAFLLLCACSQSSVQTFGRDQLQVLSASINQDIAVNALALESNFKSLKSLDADQVDDISYAWLKIDVAPLDRLQDPVLFLGHCLNINQIVFQGRSLLNLNIIAEPRLTPKRFRIPYVLLARTHEPVPLYIQVVRSHRTGLYPDCHSFGIGSEKAIVQHFINFQSLEIITGLISIFLTLASLGILALKRDLAYLYFSLFALCLGLSCVLFSHPVLFLGVNQFWLNDVWHFSVLAAPPFFLLFFQQFNPGRYLFMRGMAYLNFALVTGSILFYVSKDWYGLERYRLIYLWIVIPQILFLAYFTSRHYLFSKAVPFRIVGFSFLILFSFCLFDLVGYLFNRSSIYYSYWGVLLFLSLLMVAVVRFFMEKERNLERDKLQGLEEYAQKLEEQVRHRSRSLKEQGDLLQRSNEELAEKTILMRMSTKRMEDLVTQKDTLLQQAAEIYEQDIIPLNLAFDELKKNVDRNTIQNLSVKAHKICGHLEPFARLYEGIKAVNHKSIWLFEPDQEVMLHYRTTLGGSKVELRSYRDAEVFLYDLGRQKPDLAVINIDYEPVALKLHEAFPDVDMILTSRHDLGQHLDFLEHNPYIGHVLHQSEEDRNFAQKNLLVTATKIISNDIFGLEKYLNWGVAVKEQIITSSRERPAFVEQIQNDLQKAGVQSSLIRNTLLITEEMLMNAIYDAPHDRENGKAKYNHLSRRIVIDLEPSEYGKLRYAFDGNLIAISVEDPFGALRREIILKYLRSCFDGQFGKINEQEGKGGGGMGLFQILSTADLLITNVRPSERTEIIALINIQTKPQSRRRAGCFHYFVER